MKDRAVSLGDLRDRHPVGYAVAWGVLVGLLFGGYTWLLEGSSRIALGGGCSFAIVMTPLYYVINRRQGRFFPPGLDRESRIAVRRIVRTGAAIEDPALAPAVAFHTGAILRVPFRPGFVGAVLGCMVVIAAILLVSVTDDGNTRNDWAMGLVLVMALALLSIIPLAAQRRRRAAEAHERAQQLIATQG